MSMIVQGAGQATQESAAAAFATPVSTCGITPQIRACNPPRDVKTMSSRAPLQFIIYTSRANGSTLKSQALHKVETLSRIGSIVVMKYSIRKIRSTAQFLAFIDMCSAKATSGRAGS